MNIDALFLVLIYLFKLYLSKEFLFFSFLNIVNSFISNCPPLIEANQYVSSSNIPKNDFPMNESIFVLVWLKQQASMEIWMF